MTWSSLKNRLTSLPLLIAGPIVRRTEASNVSIWFVLKENRNVTLNIYDQKDGGTPVLTGTRNSGVGIGDHVFVYCVTASSSGFSLSSATNYYYDIDFGNGTTLSGLISDKDKKLDLTFDGSNRPSFALPPDDLNQVRLIHGSCRKPHGEGYDAMEGVHDMILESVSDPPVTFIDPIKRPHQLFLTGDQIYADDVADVMLFMIDDAASALFGWDEEAYTVKPNSGEAYKPFTENELAPGQRNMNDRLRNSVGFTGMLPNKPEYSKSHLLKFREYVTMYLFAWSDTLWPADKMDLPDYNVIHPGAYLTYLKPARNEIGKDKVETLPLFSYFDKEFSFVKMFRSTIVKVRKALANIPTYMIFDDHEITDDWNLNWRWCKEVYSLPLGRRTVQNGLLAYALFQAWGNTPDQFNESKKKELLNAANMWRGTGEGDPNYKQIAQLLNIPKIDKNSDIKDFPHGESTFFDWHFNFQASNYAVYVQDSRTWRGYPPERNEPINFAKLISQKGFEHQLPRSFPTKDIILIIAPSPVIGVPFIEKQQKSKESWEDRCDLDTEAWSLDEDGFERLLSNLVSRLPVIELDTSKQRIGRFAFFSGDVHYGMSARCQVWGKSFLNDIHDDVDTQAIFAQLTASAFKNQTLFAPTLDGLATTQILQERGYPHSKLEGAASLLTPAETRALPQPHLRFAWIVHDDSTIIGRVKFTPINNPDPTIIDIDLDYIPIRNKRGGLIVQSITDLLANSVNRIIVNPNWRYRIDWVLGANMETDSRRIPMATKIDHVSPGQRAAAVWDWITNSKDTLLSIQAWGPGKEIVGVNNFGEIRFAFTETDKKINHIMWWRMNSFEVEATPLKVLPLTNFRIPMNFSGDRDHDKNPYSQPTFAGL